MKTVALLAALLLAVGQGAKKAGRDPYQILGVPKTAQNRQIKKAFRANSKKYHPDLNPNDPEAEKNFKDSAWAYEVLSNSTLRETYDQHGEEGVNRMQQGGPPPGGGRDFPFPFPFPGGHPFFHGGGGAFHFTGGGPFGSGGGGGPFGGGQFGGGPPEEPFHQLNWFEDTSVEYFSGYQRNLVELLTNEMGDVWPDIVMTFRKDTEAEELAARAFASVAEQLDASFTFAAVDCRPRSRENSFFCQEIAQFSPSGKSPSIRYLMLTSKHFERKHTSRPLMTKGKMSTEDLIDWIFRNVPEPSISLSTRASLAKQVASAREQNKPCVVLISAEEPCSLKLRKLAAEQQNRALFALIRPSAAAAGLRKMLLESGGVPVSLREQSLMMLVADANTVTPKTTAVESLEVSDLAIDLTLAKFVGSAKQQIGPYQEALLVPRYLTADMMRRGECTPNDPNTCVLLFTFDSESSRAQQIKQAYDRASNKNMRFYFLDLRQPSVKEFLKHFGHAASGAKRGGDPVLQKGEVLIGYRAKRKKYLVKSAVGTADNFFEGIADGSLFMREGEKLDKAPTMEDR